VLVFFILPQFGTVFRGLGKDPPWHTQCLLDGARLIRAYFPILGLAVIAVLGGVLKFGGTERAVQYWDGIVLNLRFVRSATRSLLTGRTFRLLGTMLQSGIPLLEGIRLCRASVRNRLFRRLFDQMEESVVNGGSIADVLVVCPLLPGGAAQMIQTAERTGRLASVMVAMGSYYEEEGEQKVRDLVKLLEPLIIIVMGVVVSGVVMAVILPLLEVATSSH
jgi:type II secretory pathway component PulF